MMLRKSEEINISKKIYIKTLCQYLHKVQSLIFQSVTVFSVHVIQHTVSDLCNWNFKCLRNGSFSPDWLKHLKV